MMVELIERHDGKPSVHQETIKTKGCGFPSLGDVLALVRHRRGALWESRRAIV